MGCVCQDQVREGHTSDNCYFKLYDDEKAKLEALVSSRKVGDIVKDYSIYVKYSNEESRSCYL